MSIANFLGTVKDYRKANGKRYSLKAVLCIVLSGLTCGINDLAKIHRWAKKLSKKQLIQMGFYQGILLSYSNLTIILRNIDCNELTKIMSNLAGNKDQKILHIDGKFLKGSDCFGKNEQRKILTAFDSDNFATVGYEEVKTGEYQAMLKLLQKCDVEGAIITADAAFAHEEIIEEVTKQGANFAISLKGNEANLLYNTKLAFEKAAEKKGIIRSFSEDVDCRHGRIEKRSIDVIDMPWEYLNGHKRIKQLCRISRYREQKNKPGSGTTEIAYMITSLNNSYLPEYLLKLNRSHWSCENNLNWVKDNIFLEDKSTVSIGDAPIIMSLLRSFSLQLIKMTSDKITRTREFFNHNKSMLWRKLATFGYDF